MYLPIRCFHSSLASLPVLEQCPSAAASLQACVLKKDSDCMCFSHFCCFSLTEYASCGCGHWYRTFVPKVVQLENKHILKLPC